MTQAHHSGEASAVMMFGARAGQLSARIGKITDGVCVLLLALLVLDVWLGVLVRYALPLPITFMEEAARYLMIWVALLAVSACIVRREHIGVQLLFGALPLRLRRVLLAVLDSLGVAFFLFMLFYGIDLVERGLHSVTMIYSMPKAIPFAAVPVASALAALQLALVAFRDQAQLADDHRTGMVTGEFFP